MSAVPHLPSNGCSASETGSGSWYREGSQDLRLIASPNVNAPNDSTTKPMICSGMKDSQPNMRDSIPARRFEAGYVKLGGRSFGRGTYEYGAQRVGDDAMASRQNFRDFDTKEIEKAYRDPGP